MKTLLLILTLTSVAQANNCYVHPRGSDLWVTCMEQWQQHEKRQEKLDATDQRQLSEGAQIMSNHLLAEELNRYSTQRLPQENQKEYFQEYYGR